MDENNIYQGQQQEPFQQPQPIKKKKSPLLFIIPVVIVAFLVVFFVVPPVLSNSLASKGDYKKAISIVKLSPVYKSKARELKYEGYAYDCFKQLKQTFKNPDSISIRNVNSYYVSNKSQYDKYLDVTIIELTAQNGYGGNSFGYLVYDNVKKTYAGLTYDLNKTEPDASDNEEEINECSVAQAINTAMKYLTKRDVHINIDRLNKAVKSI